MCFLKSLIGAIPSAFFLRQEMYVPDDYKEPKGPTAAEISAQQTQEALEKFNANTAPTERQRGRFLKPSDWRIIETLWESGEVTLKELSEKYNCSMVTLTKHFKANGNRKGARAEDLRRAVQKHAEIQAQTEAAVISERIHKTKEDHYKMAEALAKLTFGEIVKMRQNETPYRQAQQDIKTLLLATEALKKCREERWVVLGLDKDAVDEQSLPELTLHTLTAEEVQQIRENQMEDDLEMGIEDEVIGG